VLATCHCAGKAQHEVDAAAADAAKDAADMAAATESPGAVVHLGRRIILLFVSMQFLLLFPDQLCF
jgi:hypothetical protein